MLPLHPSAMSRDHLQSKIEGDVLVEFGPRRFGTTPGGFDVRVLVSGLVRLALDTALRACGTTVEFLAEREHDHVRTVVSQEVLKFLERLEQGLEDPAPAGP